jgi:hypothetical protein
MWQLCTKTGVVTVEDRDKPGDAVRRTPADERLGKVANTGLSHCLNPIGVRQMRHVRQILVPGVSGALMVGRWTNREVPRRTRGYSTIDAPTWRFEKYGGKSRWICREPTPELALHSTSTGDPAKRGVGRIRYRDENGDTETFQESGGCNAS